MGNDSVINTKCIRRWEGSIYNYLSDIILCIYIRIQWLTVFFQYLNLSHNRMANADDAVKTFVVNLPNLLMIDLSYTSISDATLRNIGTYCLNLQILKLAQCTNFSSKGLYYLGTGKGCRILRHIDMSGCLQITTAGITIFG